LMFQGWPSCPSSVPLKRYTKADEDKLPSQAKNPRASSHGPIESALHGTGLCVSSAILAASPRNSIQLLIRKETAVRGQMTEKSDRYPRTYQPCSTRNTRHSPNCTTISLKSVVTS
jgi:hypothetical protein